MQQRSRYQIPRLRPRSSELSSSSSSVLKTESHAAASTVEQRLDTRPSKAWHAQQLSLAQLPSCVCLCHQQLMRLPALGLHASKLPPASFRHASWALACSAPQLEVRLLQETKQDAKQKLASTGEGWPGGRPACLQAFKRALTLV